MKTKLLWFPIALLLIASGCSSGGQDNGKIVSSKLPGTNISSATGGSTTGDGTGGTTTGGTTGNSGAAPEETEAGQNPALVLHIIKTILE